MSPTNPKPSTWAAVFAPRRKGERRYWLVKSEPGVFSFDDLLALPGKTTNWDGVRNFTARNFMRDAMKAGDRAFFYESMTGAPSVVGTCEVVREGYPDDTAFKAGHPNRDPKATRDNPIWYMVDLRALERFPEPVSLAGIKARPELSGMALVRIGRLSVTPVTAEEWNTICSMGGARISR